jgi:hypothetical protein
VALFFLSVLAENRAALCRSGWGVLAFGGVPFICSLGYTELAERSSRNNATVHIILSLPCGEQERQNAPSVKECATTLGILALLSATLALAEDFKTVRGKLYKDATIIRVEANGIVLKTKTGISKVYFIKLPKDVQERFHPTPAHPSPAKTAAALRQPEPIKLKGWAAVMANPTRFIIFFVAGTIIIAGVVFAIVRRRSQ